MTLPSSQWDPGTVHKRSVSFTETYAGCEHDPGCTLLCPPFELWTHNTCVWHYVHEREEYVLSLSGSYGHDAPGLNVFISDVFYVAGFFQRITFWLRTVCSAESEHLVKVHVSALNHSGQIPDIKTKILGGAHSNSGSDASLPGVQSEGFGNRPEREEWRLVAAGLWAGNSSWAGVKCATPSSSCSSASVQRARCLTLSLPGHSNIRRSHTYRIELGIHHQPHASSENSSPHK